MNRSGSLVRSLGAVGFLLIVATVIFPRAPGLPGLVEAAAFWLGVAFVLIQGLFSLRDLFRRRGRTDLPDAGAGDAPASPSERNPGNR